MHHVLEELLNEIRMIKKIFNSSNFVVLGVCLIVIGVIISITEIVLLGVALVIAVGIKGMMSNRT